jgi:4-hydroxy-3-methylbut-2-enyl diphosphate reductase
VNQTTQLATDTQEIADYLRTVMKEHYKLDESTIGERFADTRDTLCYATNDNQSAVTSLLNTPADLAIVAGGYNSSNTTHLVELCEDVLPVYFINSPEKIISSKDILHYNYHTKEEVLTSGYLPDKKPVSILITSGASCPDAVVEEIIRKMSGFFGVEKALDDYV